MTKCANQVAPDKGLPRRARQRFITYCAPAIFAVPTPVSVSRNPAPGDMPRALVFRRPREGLHGACNEVARAAMATAGQRKASF